MIFKLIINRNFKPELFVIRIYVWLYVHSLTQSFFFLYIIGKRQNKNEIKYDKIK